MMSRRSNTTECISKFIELHGHPAIAWPTFDGKDLVHYYNDYATFKYDSDLNDIVLDKILKSDYSGGVGNPNGMRHLVYQLTTILFPVES